MEDKILVNLSTDANHTFECPTNIIGREGEGYTSRFEITIPEKFTGCSVYLDFEKPNGEKLRTPKLNMENGVAVYDVHPYLLTDDGEIKAQAVLIAENGQTWKSSKKKYHIQKSINAIEEIPDKEDFITEMQRVLEDIVNASAEVEVQDDKITAIGKRVTTLESAVYGDIAQEVEDNSVAYVKDVPSNALPYAEIKKIGGMTYKDAVTQTIRSAPVTEVKSVGANLLPYPYVHTSGTRGGVTFTDNGDGSITVKGTATTTTSFNFYNGNIFEVGKTYILGVGVIVAYKDANGTSKWVGGASPNATSLAWANGYTVVMIYYQVSANKSVDETIYPFIVESTDTPKYTPYKQLITAIPIPEAVQALDGYGDGVNESAYNYIDFEKKQFVKRVGKVDMGTLNWSVYQGVFTVYGLNKKAGVYNLLTSVYTNTNANWNEMPDKTIMGYSTTGDITVTDSTYADTASFKTAMSGVMLYYELATPEVTDISDLLSMDNYIEVEGGGSLTFKNEYEYDVPSEVVFVTKGASE